MAVSAEHRTYNNTLYNNLYYIQTWGGKTRTELSDSLHGILSEQRPEKTCRRKPQKGKKNSAGDLGRIWKAHPRKATRLEGLCPYLLNMYSNKARKTLNNFRKRKQAKKPQRNSNCH